MSEIREEDVPQAGSLRTYCNWRSFYSKRAFRTWHVNPDLVILLSQYVEIYYVRYEKRTDQAALQQKEASLTLFIKNVYAFECIIIYCDVLSWYQSGYSISYENHILYSILASYLLATFFLVIAFLSIYGYIHITAVNTTPPDTCVR